MILLKLIFTIFTAVATIILLALNYRANKISRKALAEMRRAREEEYRPYVFFYIDFTDDKINFILRNDGKAPAFNIQLAVEQGVSVWNGLVGETKYTIQDMAISNKLEMIAPQDEFKEWVDSGHFFFRNNEETKKVSGKVTYENSEGKLYEFPIDIDLEPYAQRGQILRKDMNDLIRSVEKMRQDLERNW